MRISLFAFGSDLAWQNGSNAIAGNFPTFDTGTLQWQVPFASNTARRITSVAGGGEGIFVGNRVRGRVIQGLCTMGRLHGAGHALHQLQSAGTPHSLTQPGYSDPMQPSFV